MCNSVRLSSHYSYATLGRRSLHKNFSVPERRRSRCLLSHMHIKNPKPSHNYVHEILDLYLSFPKHAGLCLKSFISFTNHILLPSNTQPTPRIGCVGDNLNLMYKFTNCLSKHLASAVPLFIGKLAHKAYALSYCSLTCSIYLAVSASLSIE
jgi:hypothetical protein